MSEFNPMWEIFKDNRSQFVVVLTINLSYTYYYSSITTGSGSTVYPWDIAKSNLFILLKIIW